MFHHPSTAASVALVSCLVVSSTSLGATIEYTEDWATAGSQAMNHGQIFANYPGWTYFEELDRVSFATVEAVGALELRGVPSVTIAGLAAATSITGETAFDVSANPLTVSVDAGRAVFGVAGNYSVGLIVGDVTFLFHPGYAGGAHRVEPITGGTSYKATTDLGFTPSDTGATTISVSVVEVGTDYRFTYSIGSYNSTVDIPIATLGALDQVGVYERGAGNGFFQNFAVSQVPAPTTIATLAGTFAVAMLRRRGQ